MKKFCIKKIFISFFIVFCLIQCALGLEGQVICGIGTGIYSKNGNLYIGQLIDNSPASNSGLKSGDKIIKIDNEAITDINSASNKIRGAKGTSVNLLIERDNKQYSFNIIRDNVYVSDYIQVINKYYIYRSYLKYDNGIYYFWTKELKGATKNNYATLFPNYNYVKEYIAIDVKNQKMAILQRAFYDNNNNLLYEQNLVNDKVIFATIYPNSIGHYLYNFFSEMDKKLTSAQKSNFKGFLLNTAL